MLVAEEWFRSSLPLVYPFVMRKMWMGKPIATLSAVCACVSSPAMATEPLAPPPPGGSLPSGNESIELERMGNALHSVGDDARATRIFVGVSGLGVGALSIPVGYAVATQDGANETEKTIGYSVFGWGIGSAIGGVLSLALHIDPSERLADRFDERKESRVPAAQILRETEREWKEVSDRERRGRKFGGVMSIVVGGLALAGGSALLLSNPGSASVDERSQLHGFGAAFVGLGTLALYGGGRLLLTRSDVERSYESYVRTKPVYGWSPPALSLASLPGGAYLSLGSRF